MSAVVISVVVCVSAALVVLWSLRRRGESLGLPLAYLLGLLLIHLPGGWAGLAVGGGQGGPAVERGFHLATVGVVFFVLGTLLATPTLSLFGHGRQTSRSVAPRPYPSASAEVEDQGAFWRFCVIGGWTVVYGLSIFTRVPSVGAVIERGGALWLLGVMLGLSCALRRSAYGAAFLWACALLVYPMLMLVLGGFLSYGSTTIIIVGSFLLLRMRGYLRAAAVLIVAGFLGISIFVNYFAVRDEMRDAVWGGKSMGDRLGTIGPILTDFELFDATNPAHLRAIERRLNQNFFVGLSAERLDRGVVDYLNGRSVSEGAMSLVPRIVWPDKPVYGGSPEIVRQMTGLDLNPDTSWGVGNVMEFYVNFAGVGLAVGFLLLGLGLALLDRHAAVALHAREFGRVFVFFLPGVALIQPNGSVVEVLGGAAAALVAALGWKWAWSKWTESERLAEADVGRSRL